MDPYLHDIIVLTEMFVAVSLGFVFLFLMAGFLDEK